jgi:hypothetical protein
MSYDKSQLAQTATRGLNAALPAQWVYTSTDSAATVAGGGYISDAYDQGLRLNDLLVIIDTQTPRVSLTRVMAIANFDPTNPRATRAVTFATPYQIGNYGGRNAEKLLALALGQRKTWRPLEPSMLAATETGNVTLRRRAGRPRTCNPSP